MAKKVTPPKPHRSGVKPPKMDPKQIPQHVAVVMDGNGRWAKQRGLARTAGHEAGEAALLDMVHGAIEIGVKELSAFAFSTENWKRPKSEINFLFKLLENFLTNKINHLINEEVYRFEFPEVQGALINFLTHSIPNL